MDLNIILVIGIAGLFAIVMAYFSRQEGQRFISLRPIAGYKNLANQLGRAVESGGRLHFSLGRARLNEGESIQSLAAIKVMDRLAKDASAAESPPTVTVGEGTLLAAAQDSLRSAFSAAGRPSNYDPSSARFMAPQENPYVYGAGVTYVIHSEPVAGNILVGQFGPEVALMLEAGNRKDVDQVLGTNDPEALAIGAAVTENLLIGEEFLASGAYLEKTSAQIASIRAQDLFRWLAIAALVVSALLTLLGGSV
jgi:hypothetical protein